MLHIVDSKKYISGEREPTNTLLNIVRIQKHHLGSLFVYRSNLLENDTLFYISSGYIEFESNKIECGNIIYISRYSAFHFMAAVPTELLEIRFDYSSKLLFSSVNSYTTKAPLGMQELLNQIYHNLSLCNNLPAVNEGLLLSILNTLNISYNSYSEELNLYHKCHEWIEQNASRPVTAECTAEAMGCTVAHLNRTVKKYSSKCLSEMITEKRLSVIKQFVKYSNNSTQEIALKLGFGSAELLRKFFKYHVGISLKEYRKTII